KLLNTYTDELLGGYPRHAAHITLRTGVTRAGRILAREMQLDMDGGAYAAPKYTPHLALPSVTRGLGPYRIPHTRLEARFAYTNTVPCGAMRAPGQPQVVFASESQLDIIAEALGLDPLELRRRNVIQEGDVLPDNTKYDGVMGDAT